MARTKDPHAATVKAWKTRRRAMQGSGSSPTQVREDLVGKANKPTLADITNEVTAAYSGQVNGVIRAKDAAGKQIGYIDWVNFRDEISISMIAVSEEARGAGVATKMVERLLEESPDAIGLKWGMMTPDGFALKAKLDATLPRLREFKRQKQRRLLAAERKRLAAARAYIGVPHLAVAGKDGAWEVYGESGAAHSLQYAGTKQEAIAKARKGGPTSFGLDDL